VHMRRQDLCYEVAPQIITCANYVARETRCQPPLPPIFRERKFDQKYLNAKGLNSKRSQWQASNAHEQESTSCGPS
jgi:hypothetical protein